MSQRIQFIKEINEMNKCQQIEQMKKAPWALQYIQNPDKEVVMAAIEQEPRIYSMIRELDHDLTILIFMNEKLIKCEAEYNVLVERIYPTNELMTDKWIRYGDKMRKKCE